MIDATSNLFPTEMRLSKDKTKFSLQFNEGTSCQLTAEFLRVHSPSAEVKGHGNGPRKLVTGKENVRIVDLEMIGNYAVKLIFDDGHDTGLYTWTYLHELGQEQLET
ncbi:MAG: DUF971 domain-containing protein [Pseudomonadota bacterium]